MLAGRALLAFALAVAALVGGCSGGYCLNLASTYVATTGRRYQDRSSCNGGDAIPAAVSESAARDLACPVGTVRVGRLAYARGNTFGSYFADGCGRRATYGASCIVEQRREVSVDFGDRRSLVMATRLRFLAAQGESFRLKQKKKAGLMASTAHAKT